MHVQSRRRGFKSWFVEPYRQVKLGLMFLVVNLIFSVLILAVFGAYVWDVYRSVSSYYQLAGEQIQQMQEKFQILVVIGGALISVFVLCTIMVSVRYTHEIYGPLVSIRRFLDDMLLGQVPKALQLRESDQLQELAAKLNQLAENSSGAVPQSSFAAFHRFLDDALVEGIAEPLQRGSSAQLEELALKINKLKERIRDVS